jgi:DNA polymerase I-like protein with 3'-5' exonuclease and polymerase domains
LVNLQKVLPDDVDIVSNIHDEILLECPESRAGEIQILLEAVMKNAMTELYPEVPCEVEARVGDSWAEAK